jgi:hypothetical protein
MSFVDRIRGRKRAHHEYAHEPVDDPGVARERQRETFGGTNWGAAFFGWLVAVGLGALLTALVTAAGAAIAISEFESVGEASAETETIGLAGGIALLVVALIAYFAAGYVAGRMSRFDGGRQGVAVWLWSLLAVGILALLGAVAGEEYNLFAALDLPRIPVDEGELTTGGVVVMAAIVLGSLLAAMAGGKTGEAYHRRVDRAGWKRAPVVSDDDETLVHEPERETEPEPEPEREREPDREGVGAGVHGA